MGQSASQACSKFTESIDKPSSNKRDHRQMLLIGLDGSGKTTLIKNYSKSLDEFHAESNKSKKKNKPDQAPYQEENKYNNEFAEFYQSTPYINLEKITLPHNQMPCVVYDMSG